MKIRPNSFNIVIVGKWNKYILTPQWVAKHIFNEVKLTVEFSIDLSLPPRYSNTKSRFIPDTDRVTFVAMDCDDDTLIKLEKRAVALVNELPHTPIYSFGMNFGYSEDDLSEERLSSVFKTCDKDIISDEGYEINEFVLKRKIIKNGKIINFNLTNTEKSAYFDFNFHYDVTSIDDLENKLNNTIINNKKITEDLLLKLYSLELEVENAY